ncbi:hypothetical protein SAMN05444351_1029 [Geodermatophilus nigrescens]|uniref:Uncharacterized protein n=1 Tax=Geodermatophilus nigrescens TaxID=1070870 RepID=A0A1M5F172_9ACTN|nr:hypothetical protein SAMN05444351_1029 [Geodermatophilus nigrescens]
MTVDPPVEAPGTDRRTGTAMGLPVRRRGTPARPGVPVLRRVRGGGPS